MLLSSTCSIILTFLLYAFAFSSCVTMQETWLVFLVRVATRVHWCVCLSKQHQPAVARGDVESVGMNVEEKKTELVRGA